MRRSSSRDPSCDGRHIQHTMSYKKRFETDKYQGRGSKQSPLNFRFSSTSSPDACEGSREGSKDANFREYRRQRDVPLNSDNARLRDKDPGESTANAYYWRRESDDYRYRERSPAWNRSRSEIQEKSYSYREMYRKPSPIKSKIARDSLSHDWKLHDALDNRTFFYDQCKEEPRSRRNTRIRRSSSFTARDRSNIYHTFDSGSDCESEIHSVIIEDGRTDISPSRDSVCLTHHNMKERCSLGDIDERHHNSVSEARDRLPLIQKVAPNIIVSIKNDYGLNEEKRKLASKYLNDLLDFSPTDHPGPQGYLHLHTKRVSLLKSLKLPNLEDFILFHIAYRNLPEGNKKDFDETVSRSEVPTFDNVMTFACLAKNQSEDLSEDEQRRNSVSTIIHGAASKDLASSSRSSTPQTKCALCGLNHGLDHCYTFKVLSCQTRYVIVKDLRCCVACLGNHNAPSCISYSSCKICGKYHHTLLHGAVFS